MEIILLNLVRWHENFSTTIIKNQLNQLNMKKILWLGLILPVALVACNNSAKDSVEKADSTNEAKSDSDTRASDTMHQAGVLGVSESTSKFLVDVADVNMTEVQLGKMAAEKSANKRVKDFAEMMVKDH